MIQIGEYASCYISNLPKIAEIVSDIMDGIFQNAAVNGKEFLQCCRMILTDAVNSSLTNHHAIKQTHRSTLNSSPRCIAYFADSSAQLSYTMTEPTMRKGDSQRSLQVAGTYVLMNILLRKTEKEHDTLKAHMLKVVDGKLDPDTGGGP